MPEFADVGGVAASWFSTICSAAVASARVCAVVTWTNAFANPLATAAACFALGLVAVMARKSESVDGVTLIKPE